MQIFCRVWTVCIRLCKQVFYFLLFLKFGLQCLKPVAQISAYLGMHVCKSTQLHHQALLLLSTSQENHAPKLKQIHFWLNNCDHLHPILLEYVHVRVFFTQPVQLLVLLVCNCKICEWQSHENKWQSLERNRADGVRNHLPKHGFFQQSIRQRVGNSDWFRMLNMSIKCLALRNLPSHHTWNLSGTSAVLISLSLLVNIPFSSSLGSNTQYEEISTDIYKQQELSHPSFSRHVYHKIRRATLFFSS